jgi:putative hemolysin
LDEFAEKTGLVLPEGPYDTLAGFFMARLGQLPSVGDAISLELASVDPSDEERAPVELRVSELDGRRASTFVVHRQDGKDFTPP